jgi:hypothetical protein
MLHNPHQLAQAREGSEGQALLARTLALGHALSERGILPEAPPYYGVAPLRAVHSAAYLAFLESAFERWAEEAGAGLGPRDVVLPTLSPYYVSQCRGADRGGCSSVAIVAQAGYYLGDQSSRSARIARRIVRWQPRTTSARRRRATTWPMRYHGRQATTRIATGPAAPAM